LGDGIGRNHLLSSEGRWFRSNGVVEQWSNGRRRIQPFDIAPFDFAQGRRQSREIEDSKQKTEVKK